MTRRRFRAPDDATGAPRRANAYLMPTLIDRLADTAPHRQHEAPDEYAMTRSQMRDIVQRDLAYLLNTTSLDDLLDRERYPEAAASTINYGVPALAGTFVASRNWADIEQIIRRAILDFEPRLIPGHLMVVPMPGGEAASYNNVSFEIRGMIQMDPYPLEFMVQSTLDLETSQLNVARRRSE
ncbi:type VI secretion system baseplate subunit TssE [Paraburkholderia acidisoli]|uniref:Type VI secretion system baseplate subunit TssE n=1 Tax=Paraburkholderia acidisoli TaxID=2571748 RepID=A0A7Z2JIP3_9BURK|nr:type VI secretion system baseplate subunit TssE [Paraburkholderia acidisoli]QGZ64550.1 type VI secretion system baseplate subunit TssE [Paraburkholderia acidisoli]